VSPAVRLSPSLFYMFLGLQYKLDLLDLISPSRRMYCKTRLIYIESTLRYQAYT
jgi:hypothetical protein